jgi:hypothetical protein
MFDRGGSGVDLGGSRQAHTMDPGDATVMPGHRVEASTSAKRHGCWL